MGRNDSIIPSIAWHLKASFEYEINLLKFEKDEHKRKIIEDYFRERIKELKEKNK